MPRRKRATKVAQAVPAGALVYRVRLVIPGSVLHVVSATRPVVRVEGDAITSVDWMPLVDSELGDTVAFIRWEDVSALAWRPARIALTGGEAQGSEAQELAGDGRQWPDPRGRS